MASLNQQSVRAQLDALKAQCQQLSARGKMSRECQVLFAALLALVDIVVAVFMEKTTKKDARNSSKPSSQTDKDDSAIHVGAKSHGTLQTKTRSSNTRTVETLRVVKVSVCEHCGEDLRATPCHRYERRTLIDIVFEKVVTHLDAQIKDCPHCATQTKAAFPAELSGPLQYGAGIKAYLLNQFMAHMLSLKRLQQSLHTLIGAVIAEATILHYVLQLEQALERWEHAAIEQLLASPALHADETSLRVDRHNRWIHVYSAGDITLKFLHPKRGNEAIKAINIIPRYGGDVIHDCWASYLSYDHCGHGLCGSHLLRELTFIVDSNHYPWATQMKALLKAACKTVAKRKRKQLTQSEYQTLQRRYRHILTRGAKQMPLIPEKQTGQRGRVAKSDAHNLWERLKRYETAVLLFAKHAHVPFTNNRAERDLRMSKVKQKVSGCFRQARYAAAYCRISSYLQTMSYQGYNPLVAIQMALSGELYAEGGE
jgi:transposase